MKKILLKLMPVAAMIAALSPASAFSGSRTGVKFVEGTDAVNMILSGPSTPCVPRLPTWELSIGEGTYNGFLVKKSNMDCRGALSEAVRDFSDEEKNTLMTYVVLIDSLIDAEFPALNTIPWSFAVIGDSADFGIPSSSEHIILTKGLLGEMENWMEKKSSMLFVGLELLIHEKTRLLQGMNPAPFERFYKDVWEFRKTGALPPDKLTQDGFYFANVPPNEWVIRIAPNKGKEYIMPAILLRDIVGKGTGGTVQRVAIVVDSTAKGFVPRKGKRMPVEYRDLRMIPQYRKKFSQSEYDYHPVALSADLAAKFLVAKYVSAQYGTAPVRVAHYSQIDALIKTVNEAVK